MDVNRSALSVTWVGQEVKSTRREFGRIETLHQSRDYVHMPCKYEAVEQKAVSARSQNITRQSLLLHEGKDEPITPS